MTSSADAVPGALPGDLLARGDARADRGAAPAPAAGPVEPLGGDPACWLNRVCDACGRFVDDEGALTCPACGAPR